MSLFVSMGAGPNPSVGSQSANAQRETISSLDKVARLEEHLEKLTLVCAALWDLVKERGKWSEEDLAARVAVLASQGKMSHAAHPCCKCGRPVTTRHRTCMYCGAPQPVDGIFESI